MPNKPASPQSDDRERRGRTFGESVPEQATSETAVDSSAAGNEYLDATAEELMQALPAEESLAELTLTDLRQLRRDLTARESHISYWRRIIQARLDLLTDGVAKNGATRDGLRRILTRQMGTNNRLGLMSVQPTGNQPMAGLDHLWHRSLDVESNEADLLDEELRSAERQLSALRSTLHDQIDAATAELIGRYRENPELVFTILPHRSDKPNPL